MIKKIDHIVITTAKPAECIEFYEGLGFKSRNAGGRYELFAGDFKINVHIKGAELEPKARNVQTGSADICLEIDANIDAEKVRLESLGIEIELGVVPRNGVRGPMRSLYMRDPDENLVELCVYE